jgi:hypothetical protein
MFTESLPSNDGGRGGKPTYWHTGKVFSLQSNVKLYKDDNSLLRTVVSSQAQHAETWQLEHLITKPLPINVLLHSTFLTSLFQLSGVMSRVYKILQWLSLCLHYPSFQDLGGRYTDTQQGNLLGLLKFLLDKESKVKKGNVPVLN